ncbi:MAG: ribbon-helix-helix domain-containing protein [Acidimicrobiales bacterium]|jgi:Arc/MetJ-type ribon-helix-helix transcriptional regulator
MKVSVSLPEEDIEFLDAYVDSQGFASRSAVVHKAVRLLRAAELGAAYEDAFGEWSRDEADLWDSTVADGLS